MEKPIRCINCTAIFAKKKFLTIHLKEECGNASDSLYELHLSQRNHVHGTQFGRSSVSNNSFYMHNCMPSQMDEAVHFEGVVQQQPRQRSGDCDWERIDCKIERDQLMEIMVNDRDMKPSHGNNAMMLHGPIDGPGQGSATHSMAALKWAGCLKRSASPPTNFMGMGSSGQYGVKRQSLVFKNDSDGHDEMGFNTGMSTPQRQMWFNYSGKSQSGHDIKMIDQKPFLTKGQSLQQNLSMAMTPVNRNTNFNSQIENNSNYMNVKSDLFLPNNRNPLPSPHNSGGISLNDFNTNTAVGSGFGFLDNCDDFGQQRHSFIPMNSDDRQIENIISNSGNSSSNLGFPSRPSLTYQQNYGNPNFNPDNLEENWDDNPNSGVNEGHNYDESMEHPDHNLADNFGQSSLGNSNTQISNLNSFQDSRHQSSSSDMRRAIQKPYKTNRSLNRKHGYKQFRGNNGGRNMGLNNNGSYGQLSENCQQPFGPQSLLSDALVVVVAHPSIGSACLNVPRPGLGRPALVQDQRTVDKPVTTKKTKSEKRTLKIARKRGFILGGFKLPYFDNKTQQLPQPEKESYVLAFFEEKPIYTINVKNEDDEVIAAVVFDDADQKNTKRARKQLRTEWTTLHDSKDYKNWKNWWTDFKRYGAEIHKELVKLGCLNLEHCFSPYKPNSVKLSTEQVVHGVIKSLQLALGDTRVMPYEAMKSIVTLMNTTFLENLKSELYLKAVQDTIRSVPNDLWLFKMRSMVVLWVKYNYILNNENVEVDQGFTINWMAKQAFKNPCFHWLAMLAFSELETISELAWSDHEKEFPTI